MPAPFKQLNREQFAALLASYKFTRKINSVHLHHTWRPNHSQYKGHASIVAMWEYHTKKKGWSDIAQHLTIGPRGEIWLGRNWNAPPASASGHNGTTEAGPFMLELIGNFDTGHDVFGGEQRQSTIEVIARIQYHFGLQPGALQFHNMMSTKTCPGSAIDYDRIVSDVATMQAHLFGPKKVAGRRASPFPPEMAANTHIVQEGLDHFERSRTDTLDPPDASPCEHGMPEFDRAVEPLSRSMQIGPAQRQAMLPHIVNLSSGQLSSSGEWQTTPEDLDAIFDEHLPAALAAAPAGTPLRLMLYAHGGLTSEMSGLAKARVHIEWWKRNNVYPIYFIWETSFCDALQALLANHQRDIAGARNLFSDKFSDPLLEHAAHTFGGVKIWGAMKQSALLASASNLLGTANGAKPVPGGAHELAERLARFCTEHDGQVEVHAAGHSAGSVFHAHYVPQALRLKLPSFKSVHLMAPAVRCDVFKQQLMPLLGKEHGGIEALTMYTMRDSFERDDNCGKIYRKSLLYLIEKALEPEIGTPLLGLESSVRKDSALKTLFGVGGNDSAASVVWAPSALARGRDASQSTTHGGFDDDPATMESIARRVLDLADTDSLHPYPAPEMGRFASPWMADQFEQVQYFDNPMPSLPPGQPAPAMAQQPVAAGGGTHRALCVGINEYPSAPLQGCVNDAHDWKLQLNKLGFDCAMLLNGEATRSRILGALEQLVVSSQPGDMLVFQFAGHGTVVPDLNGDEARGGDEAMCPVDFASGELLIDDDIGAVFDRLPDGVNLTCFFDCCHSGTISRIGSGRPSAPGIGEDLRARFIDASAALKMAYARKRAQGDQRAVMPAKGIDRMREIVFSACLDDEVAWESGGRGEFTVRAMQAFAHSHAGLSNAAFAKRITEYFGATPRQHAKLYCAPAAQERAFLQPLVTASSPAYPAYASLIGSESDSVYGPH